MANEASQDPFGLLEGLKEPKQIIVIGDDPQFNEKEEITATLAKADLSTMSPKDYSDIMALQLEGGYVEFSQIVKMQKLKKTVELFFKKPQVKSFMEEEAGKYAKGENKMLGMQFLVKASGVKYNYTSCGHMGLNAAYKLMAELKAYIKKVETSLRTIELGDEREEVIKEIPVAELAFEDCGEIATLLPPIKTSSITVEWKTA